MEGGFFNSDYRGNNSISAHAPVGNNKTRENFIESMPIPDNYLGDYKSIIMRGSGGESILTSAPVLYYHGKKFDAAKLEQEPYQYARKKGGPGKLYHLNNRNPRGFVIMPTGRREDFGEQDEVILVITPSDEIRGAQNNGFDADEASRIAEPIARTNPTPSIAMNLDGGQSAQIGVAEVRGQTLEYLLHVAQTRAKRENSTFFVFRRKPSQEHFQYLVTDPSDETLPDTRVDEFSAQQRPATFEELQKVRLLVSNLNFSAQPNPPLPKPERAAPGAKPEPRPTPTQISINKLLQEVKAMLAACKIDQRPLREYLLNQLSACATALKEKEHEAHELIDIMDMYLNSGSGQGLPGSIAEQRTPQLLVSDEAAKEILKNLQATEWQTSLTDRLFKIAHARKIAGS